MCSGVVEVKDVEAAIEIANAALESPFTNFYSDTSTNEEVDQNQSQQRRNRRDRVYITLGINSTPFPILNVLHIQSISAFSPRIYIRTHDPSRFWVLQISFHYLAIPSIFFLPTALALSSK
ncbi:hypothetical protein P9112_010046 [Eukaryota sp. TZLM1-RC]